MIEPEAILERLRAMREAIAALSAAPEPGAIVLPPYVAAGEPIESAWGNLVVDALSELALVTPIGSITMFGGTFAPVGWAFCDGAVKSTTDPTYAALFAVIGYAYGGSGETFQLPNLQGRFALGRGGGAGWDTVGDSGGSKDAIVPSHTHSTPAHSHPVADHNHTINHDHGSVYTNSVGAHQHNITTDTSLYAYDNDDLASSVNSGPIAMNWKRLADVFTAQSGAHNHSVDLPNYTGNSSTKTGLSTTSSGGGTTGAASGGVAVTDKNMPPFQVVNYIVRIG